MGAGMIGALVLALMAAPSIPASQTCPDGTVVLASDTCPPYAPRTQLCDNGSVILAADSCAREVLALHCIPAAGSGEQRQADLYLREDMTEWSLRGGLRYYGATDASQQTWVSSNLSSRDDVTQVAFEIRVEPDAKKIFAARFGSIEYGCHVD